MINEVKLLRGVVPGRRGVAEQTCAANADPSLPQMTNDQCPMINEKWVFKLHGGRPRAARGGHGVPPPTDGSRQFLRWEKLSLAVRSAHCDRHDDAVRC